MFDYQDAPVIESFTLGEEKDGRMDVSFRVTRRGPLYSYKIHAAVKKGGDEKELTSGSARTNSDVKTSVDLRSLQAIQPICSSFTFGIRITKRITSIRCIPGAFSYKNSDKASSMKRFRAFGRSDAALLYVSWPGIDYDADGVLRRFSRTMKRSPPFLRYIRA